MQDAYWTLAVTIRDRLADRRRRSAPRWTEPSTTSPSGPRSCARAAFQNTQFELATSVTEVDVLEAYLDKAVLALNAGTLTAVNAAKAKLWATEVSTGSWTGARSCSAVTTT